MNLKPGDRVSFLNEKRDGIVKKILQNKMVIVEIEDGFEIPVISSDLVKVNAFDDEEQNDNKYSNRKNDTQPEPEERFPERFGFDTSLTEDLKLKKGFYIAFIPENDEQMLQGNYAVYILNNTKQDALFTYYLKENDKYICTDFDRVDEASALMLSNIDKSQFEKWEHIKFHFIYFKKENEIFKNPEVIDIRVKPLRFYKEENYNYVPAIGEKCFLIPLSEKEVQQPEEWKEEQWKNEKVLKSPGIKIIGHIKDMAKPSPFPKEHIIEHGVAEVDLHIEELVDDLSKFKNNDFLNFQIEYFIKMLDSAIANKFKNIIFIHGVGNGSLKKEIITKLKNNYPDLSYQDASMLKYGKGAINISL
ncbi:MAG TPA: DUF2027 domain-containing protein [Bacteroidales bacterium]|nr:DUF2027 domain-containing protein [Bacteroidales bacterium]HPS15616.1 DUF2027 domain-containing protein [Bacteroidales bacterium]